MAKHSDIALRSQVIYSVFVRNHTEEGTFLALIPDLERIRALGTDIIWLMPIHPIGREKRKGSLGSPYAIRDYRAINPELGTLEDFQKLVAAIHALGMKVIIDVVFNHTSPDAVYTRTHPEFYYRKADGSFGNRVGDWSDIIDLDYSDPGLWDAQCDALTYWAQFVDGFRCDVASFVPLEFWLRARAEVEKVRPGCIWFAESVAPSFAFACEPAGVQSVRDAELYEAFDMEYEYDIRDAYREYLRGETTIGHYLSMANMQEYIYPENYNKVRYLENHDSRRIAELVSSRGDLINHMAMCYFLKGTTMLYAGQEFGMSHRTSLFDRDTIDRTGPDYSRIYAHLGRIKKEWLSPEDRCLSDWDNARCFAKIRRTSTGGIKLGVFALTSGTGTTGVYFPDGLYENAFDGRPVRVSGGTLNVEGSPIILSTRHPYREGNQKVEI
ncbi:MAG: alpha-amylase [Clostridia bacterium]|nr:alpha-amylase [Clostridia bacterium]